MIIIDPKSFKSYSITSKYGKFLLKQYINYYMKFGGSLGLSNSVNTAKINPKNESNQLPINSINIEEFNVKICYDFLLGSDEILNTLKETLTDKNEKSYQIIIDDKNTKISIFQHIIDTGKCIIQDGPFFPVDFNPNHITLNLHTHPNYCIDQLAIETHKKEVINSALPTDLDVMGTINASIYYSKQCVSGIISKKGLCVYSPSKELMELISENKGDKDMIIDVIATNSKKYAFKKHNDIELHQEFKRILNPEDETNEHAYIHMYYHTFN